MKQAMAIAAVMEFAGAVSVGSRVAATIRNDIIEPHLYDSQPAVLLLAMMCAIIGSSTFLTIATRLGFPVSTTHSIIGGLVGAGTASIGIQKVNWEWDGVSQIFAAWVIAPGIAGCFGALLFLITKHVVLTRKFAVRNAFISIPIYTFITVGALVMLVVWKGIQLDVDLSDAQIAVCVFAVAGGITALQCFFVLPFLWRRIMHEDWELKWYHYLQGPSLLKRPQPPPPPPGTKNLNIKDYYRGHLTKEELETIRASESLLESIKHSPNPSDATTSITTLATPTVRSLAAVEAGPPPRPLGPWNSYRVLLWRIKRTVLRGLEQDVIRQQKRSSILSYNIADIHARAPRYDNRAEYMYSSLQILTAAAASFIHGASDVSNAIAPFTSAYFIWRTGSIQAEVSVPIWILCFGGIGISLGLLMYGYRVMRNLGNRLTLMSPSRGFCMEMGGSLTVLMATRLAIPVSSTQCIAGAAIGVGLANGDWKSINWRLVGWIYLGWLITVPTTGFLAGSLMAIIIKAPRW
jgi:solute carrier family 20 (sodium-dependent phosphate transporter)